MGDNSIYSHTKVNMEPSGTFYEKQPQHLVLLNENYWIAIQSCRSYEYVEIQSSCNLAWLAKLGTSAKMRLPYYISVVLTYRTWREHQG